MKYESIDGLVLRETKTGENDLFLSVLTAKKGRFGILAKGARSIKGTRHAACQLFTYASFEYHEKNGIHLLDGGSVHNSFFGICENSTGYYLGTYLSELACELSDENVESEELLRLLLNAFHVLKEQSYPVEVVKPTVELRAMALTGFEPQLHACAACGCKEGRELFFNVEEGTLVCRECISAVRRAHAQETDDARAAQTLIPLNEAVLAAMRYCVAGPLSRIFSFSLEDAEDLTTLGKTAEKYMLAHLERGFETLKFYRRSEEFDSEMQRIIEEGLRALAKKKAEKQDLQETNVTKGEGSE